MGSRAPIKASTATTAATALAALPPRPLDSGSPFAIVSSTPPFSPAARSSACAATPALFLDASRGNRPASPVMSAMRTPPAARRAVTSSPGVSSAKPSTSNPHATLETVAGAKAVTDSIEVNILLRSNRRLRVAETEHNVIEDVTAGIARGSSG